MSKREAGKADRRRRIVEAARELIRETGDTGLSMRAIAARANVSLATPYNLFGSKRAIVMAVMEARREFGERFSAHKNLSAIDRIFKAMSITLSYHVEEPEFYRALWTSMLDRTGSSELRAEVLPPENAQFWLGLLQEAQAEGSIAEDIDLGCLHRELGNTFTSVMLSWVMGGYSAEELETAVCYGYALSLTGAASEAALPKLRKRMLDYQKRLSKLRKEADAASAA